MRAPLNVYISASWKQRDRVRALAIELRKKGLEVYDFTDPTCRSTPEIPPERYPEQFDPEKHVYKDYLNANPAWRDAVICNKDALDRCDIVVLLLPAGNDSHADWAYAVGRGKLTCIAGHPKAGERSKTHLWATKMVETDQEAIDWCALDEVVWP